MRISRIRRTILSLLGVLLAYGVYAACVVPFVEPTQRQEELAEEPANDLKSSATDRYVRELSPLFPEGSWELNHPKVLRNEQATILLQEFEELEDGRLHVRPCTIVLYGSKKNQKQAGPTIMQAPQGAILAFDEPLDLSSGRFGKPVSGQLVGGIRIVRVGSKDTEDLELVTSNVVISNKQIWTRDQVSFRVGNTYGTGSELLITRVESGGSAKKKNKLLDDLGTIELQRVQKLSFEMEKDDLFESFSTAGSAPKPNHVPGQKTAPTKIEVRCQGPMIFDLVRMKATLEENVTVTRQEPGAQPDRMLASNLSMDFAKVKTATKSTDADKTGKSELTITKLVAEGKPLVIDARSKRALLESKRLEYDFQTRRLKVFGANPFATKKTTDAPGHVLLRGPEYEINAPSIEFHNHEDRSKWELHAEGAGKFAGAFEGSTPVEASWTKDLSLTPRMGQQVLQIQGAATVQSPASGTVVSDVIELWLQQIRQHTGTRLDGTPIFKTETSPTKLVTRSNSGQSTKVDSEQFSGTLASMEIVFQSNPHPAPSGNDERSNPFGNFQTTSVSPSDPNATNNRKPKSKFMVNGGDLAAWVDPISRDVHRLIVKGNSRIVEESKVGQRPFQLEGNLIDLAIVGGVPVVQLSGSPAKVGSPDLDASGSTITLDATQNMIHIPGSGSLTVQASKDFFGKLTPETQRSVTPVREERPSFGNVKQPTVLQPITVSWQQGLHFDGKIVTIAGKVQAKGEDISFATEDVKLTLDQPIDLSKLSSGNVRPELKYVSARGGVSATVQARDELNAPKSFQQIFAQNLEADFVSGDIQAAGPGRLTMTSPGKLMPDIRPNASRTTKESSTSELSHLSIAFKKQLDGNMHRREVHLYDNVRMWMGPVEYWKSTVDPSQRSLLRKDDVWMSCHELFAIESPTAAPTQEKKPIELLARGEAYVEGQLFAAKGHEIKYAQEKDMLTLEGDADKPAQLWQRKSANERGTSQGRVRRIRFWPKSQKVVLDGFLRFDVSSAPKKPAN